MPGTRYQPATLSDVGQAAASVGAAAATQEFINNGLMWLRLTTNATAGGVSVTIANKTTIDGQAGPNLVIAVPASSTYLIGPFPRGIYNNANAAIEVAINTPANVTALESYQMGGGV